MGESAGEESEDRVPPAGPPLPRLVKGNGWIALGLGLLVVAVLLALATISVHLQGIESDCGTWLAPAAPDDRVIGRACESAQRQRTWLVLVPVLLAVLSIVGGVLLRRRGRRADRTRTPDRH